MYAGNREEGYFPENLLIYWPLLVGIRVQNKKFLRWTELIRIFDLEHVNKSGAKSDPDKAKWFQHQHCNEILR